MSRQVSDAVFNMGLTMLSDARMDLEQMESPIEALMAVGILYTLGYDICTGNIIVIPQQKIGAYRVDFSIEIRKANKTVIVECDGHDFHEKKKEQAARDKKRDRYLSANGHTVIRFTGSEICRDHIACGWEVFDIVKRLADINASREQA